MKSALAAFLLLAAVQASNPQPVRLPVYGARHAVDEIRIDGKLDEATWMLSPRIGEIRLIHDPSRRPAFPTEAAMAWDEANLYVAFANTDAEPWGRLKSRDARLWGRKSWRCFSIPTATVATTPSSKSVPTTSSSTC